MSVVGIIAEYNPFHNGHLHLIEKAKEMTGATHVIALMSGDFVQRGLPAICDKYARSRMALLSGVDAVFELPVRYAASGAERFSYGGVAFLSMLGIIDFIAFGSECGDLSQLKKLAEILADEPEEYKKLLRDYLKQGLSFPAARENALVALQSLSDSFNSSAFNYFGVNPGILRSPNNILAVEYLKAAIRLLRAGIKVPELITVKRSSSYLSVTPENEHDASADAIRSILGKNPDSTGAISSFMPSGAYKVFSEIYGKTFPVRADDFSSVLFSRLISIRDAADLKSVSHYYGIPSDMLNSILKYSETPVSFSSLSDSVKSRNYTYTSVCRALTSIMLDLPFPEDPVSSGKKKADPSLIIPYARILGLKKESSGLIKQINNSSGIEVINKLADAKTASPLLKEDIRAARLYNQIIFERYNTALTDEYRQSPVLV